MLKYLKLRGQLEQAQKDLEGMTEARDRFCHAVNEIAITIGMTGKAHYAPEAVLRRAGLIRRQLEAAEKDVRRLDGIINNPENFMQAVSKEAAHQTSLHGRISEDNKKPGDWMWDLAGMSKKILEYVEAGEVDKAQRQCIVTAALLMNWQRIILAETVAYREGFKKVTDSYE